MSRPDQITLPTGAPRPSRPFFARASGREFKARTDAKGATVIDIFDEIGPFGVDVADVESQLRDAGDVVLRVTSPGGDVFAGLAIHSLLAAHPGHVRVEVLGIAASAASLLIMAADTIAMASNAHAMMHRAWGLTVGNVADHDEAAALLRRVDASMAATYAERSGQTLARINEMLEAETWFTADEAIEAGFADELLEPATPKARFDLSVYAKAPAELSAPIERDNPTIRDVEHALRDGGFSHSQAKALAARGHKGDAEQLREAAEIAELAAHISAAATSIQK